MVNCSYKIFKATSLYAGHLFLFPQRYEPIEYHRHAKRFSSAFSHGYVSIELAHRAERFELSQFGHDQSREGLLLVHRFQLLELLQSVND